MLSLILAEHEKLIGKVAWRESCLEIGKVHCRKLQSFWMSFDKSLLLHVKSSNFEFPAKIIKRALFQKNLPFKDHRIKSRWCSWKKALVENSKSELNMNTIWFLLQYNKNFITVNCSLSKCQKQNLDSTFFVYGFICILQSLPCCIQYSNLYSSKAKSTNKLIIILRLAEVFPTPPFAEASSKNTTAQTINVRYKILCDIMDETLN